MGDHLQHALYLTVQGTILSMCSSFGSIVTCYMHVHRTVIHACRCAARNDRSIIWDKADLLLPPGCDDICSSNLRHPETGYRTAEKEPLSKADPKAHTPIAIRVELTRLVLTLCIESLKQRNSLDPIFHLQNCRHDLDGFDVNPLQG